MKTENINLLKRKYFLISLSILTISILIRLYIDTVHIQNMLDKSTEKFNTQLHTYFHESRLTLFNKYTMLSRMITLNPQIQEMIKENKREALQNFMHSYYEQLKKDNKHLFVMHFLDTHNKTILRMHKPNSFDDDLTEKRPIVRYVNQTKKPSHGFEVGKNGITYRITSAIFDKDKNHIGVLEFGITPSYFIEKMQEHFETKALFLVKTDDLKILLDSRSYETIDEYSIVSKDMIFNRSLFEIDLSKHYQFIENEEKTYMLHNDLKLSAYNGEERASLLVLKDISVYKDWTKKMIYLSSFINLFALLSIGTIIYIMLHKYTNSIQSLRSLNNIISKKAKIYKTKANTDHLTKLYNREFLKKYWTTHEFSQQKDNICMMFDIDHFKRINDSYGHDVGDAVLKHLADLSKHFFREDDILIRYGGEEFIVLFDSINYENACKKAEKFRLFIAQHRSFAKSIQVTLSIGITAFKSYETKDDVIKRADEALYEAKHSGRNKVVKV